MYLTRYTVTEENRPLKMVQLSSPIYFCEVDSNVSFSASFHRECEKRKNLVVSKYSSSFSLDEIPAFIEAASPAST